MEEIRLHPERPALNGWHLERIIDKWLSHCHGRVSEKTLSGYAEKILYFRRWWTDTGPSRSWVLTEDDFARFNRDLELTQSRFGKPLSLNTRNDAMRRLRQMLHWAYERGHMSFDYGKWVPTPDGSAPLRTAPPLDDLRRLIEATQVSEMPTRIVRCWRSILAPERDDLKRSVLI